MKKTINGVEYDLTEEDIIQREKDRIAWEEEKAAKERFVIENEQKKQSAFDKLKLLGLTEDEIKSIINIK